MLIFRYSKIFSKSKKRYKNGSFITRTFLTIFHTFCDLLMKHKTTDGALLEILQMYLFVSSDINLRKLILHF